VALLAAARLQESSPLPLDPSDEAWFDACLSAATEALGPDAVALAGVRGGAMDLDAALALAARVASRD